MHRRLGEILVGGRAITAEVRDRALAQQARTRGRIGTNLLEMSAIREDLLLRALSVQHGIAPAVAIDLADVRPDILRLVPARLAATLFVVPFRRLGRVLHLAMRDPKDLPAIDEIAFLTGLAVTPFVALDLRIQTALSRFYGAPVENRYSALQSRLDAHLRSSRGPSGASAVGVPASEPVRVPSPKEMALPPPPSFGGRERQTPHPFRSTLSAGSDPWESGLDGTESVLSSDGDVMTETLEPQIQAPTWPAAIEVEGELLSRLRPETASVEAGQEASSGRTERQPEPEEATGAVEAELPAMPDLMASLANAVSRDDVASAILRSLPSGLRRMALFIAQRDRVIGWAAVPEPPQGLRSFSVAFSEPSVFASLRDTEGFYVGPCPDLPGNRRVLEALGTSFPAWVTVVPVTLKGKSVLFLFGEAEPGKRLPPAPELKRLAALTAVALEILLLKNRLRSLGGGTGI